MLPVNGMHPEAVAAADLNGDGVVDLAAVLVSNPGGQAVLAIFPGRGSGGFQPGSFYPLQATAGVQSGIGIGDLNGDGIPDVAVVSNFGQRVDILLGNGTGGFTERPVLPASLSSGANSLVITDVSGDGNLDLVLGDGTYLPGNGDGTFQTAQQVIIGATPASVAVTNLGGVAAVVAAGRGGTITSVLLIPSRTSH
jgi:hypothetical protein